MPKYLFYHRWTFAVLSMVCSFVLLIFLWLGQYKSISEWNWIDIFGEGGATVFIGIWIFFIIKSRRLGYVTHYILLGLCFIFFHMWMDLLDEFIRIPKEMVWDAWLESIPFPIGLCLLTIGIYFWHIEELAINKQLQKRERIFRDHRLFDALTPLADAHYFKNQLKATIEAQQQQNFSSSVVLFDMHNFNKINQQHGFDEGTAILQHVSQLLSLNLRSDDLLCRFAGDRFIILLPHTSLKHAEQIALQLEQIISFCAYYHHQHAVRIPLKAMTTCCEVHPDHSVKDILYELNQNLVKAKQGHSLQRVIA